MLSKADCSNKKKKTTLKFKFVCVYFDFKVELNFLKLNQVIQTEAHIIIPIDRKLTYENFTTINTNISKKSNELTFHQLNK